MACASNFLISHKSFENSLTFYLKSLGSCCVWFRKLAETKVNCCKFWISFWTFSKFFSPLLFSFLSMWVVFLECSTFKVVFLRKKIVAVLCACEHKAPRLKMKCYEINMCYFVRTIWKGPSVIITWQRNIFQWKCVFIYTKKLSVASLCTSNPELSRIYILHKMAHELRLKRVKSTI